MPEEKNMARPPLVCGLVAHVDAGKTTLSEALLYVSGQLRRQGRVDHRDAFLDTDQQERERGITIFSKQARISWRNREITLMDTPGHVDFSAEAERVLSVLDCAVLVISGADGVQGHTLTLWKLLEAHGLPVFLFINKMDQPGVDRDARMRELRERFGDGCVELSAPDGYERAAIADEDALNEYLETGKIGAERLVRLVAGRRLFPCIFGAALRGDGADALLNALVECMPVRRFPEAFGARVFKIARDPQGARLTYLRVTGGTLRVRALLSGAKKSGEAWQEKVSQIRLYSGAKFVSADEAAAGGVCAVTGLNATYAGEGLGAEPDADAPALEPVFVYRVYPAPEADPHKLLSCMRVLEEEDPLLSVQWNEALREIHVSLMGEVQLEILKRALADRFGMSVRFDEGGILYKETILNAVEGVGHYEPLRHYAEVHLLLEPGSRGSGVEVGTCCPEDELEHSWQRLILKHLTERQPVGVLAGMPVTDIRITLVAGRAHLKHTEGGDFGQATHRAVRQGLMQAQSQLLEPWYDIRLEIPADCLGRAMSDLTQMGGSFGEPARAGDEVVLLGRAPVAEARGYARDVAAYTRGRGRVSLTSGGYEPCRNADAVLARIGYDPERDTWNPADSVFCQHGAGVIVKWNEAPARMHIQTELFGRPTQSEATSTLRTGRVDIHAEDEELMRIFERTYGQVRRRDFEARPAAQPAQKVPAVAASDQPPAPEYLLVDGYNIVNAWPELKARAQTDLEGARLLLMDILSNYQGFTSQRVILVFDAYRVPNNPGRVVRHHNIDVVYTAEAETADSYIEKATYEISKRNRVRVATSDGLEQLIILGNGALRVPATELRREVEAVNADIRRMLDGNNAKKNGRAVERALRKAMEERES